MIHAANDDIVLYKSNLKALQQSGNFGNNIKTVALRRGNHCSFGKGYQWKHISNLYNGFINHHGKYKNTSVRYNIAPSVKNWKGIFGGKLFKLHSDEQIVNYNFTNYERGVLKLSFRVFDGSATINQDEFCDRENPLNADMSCYKSLKGRIKLDLSLLGLRGKMRKARILRFLNSNSRITGKNGKDVIGTRNFPQHLTIRKF